MRLALTLTTVWLAAGTAGADWPQWRGPLATGVAPDADPPLTWSEEHNVRWKVAIPGKGHSTPAVWGNRLFLTTAVPVGPRVEAAGEGQRHEHDDGAHDNMRPDRRMDFVVLALDRRNGNELWRRTVRTGLPHEATHVTGSWASASPVTDGKHVWASFGSAGLYCLTVGGEPVWSLDLGNMRTRHEHGEGSSPALHGDTLVVTWDHQGDSFVVALDKRTGRERWRVARDEITSWSSPLVVEHGGKAQVIVAATRRTRAYDLATGKVIWECGGLSRNVVATPVSGDGLVIVANSYDTRSMLAVRLARARGDVTGTDAVAWTLDRDTPYVPSPLLYDGRLFFLKHYQGFLTSVDAATGKRVFGPVRLPGIRNVFASPAGAGGRVYVLDRNGTAVVVEHDAPFRVLATNRLDDSFSASPVIVGKDLFLRGERHIYALAQEVGP